MAAPPKAREGLQAASAGRPVIAAVAPFLRTLPSRATRADLWASIDALAVETEGYDRLEKRHGTSLDPQARARFGAYVAQAKEYYSGLADLDPVAKPLLAYYFVLNLTKAFLTAVDPDSTKKPNLVHGLIQDFQAGTRYYVQQEGFKTDSRGVFRLLANRTGHGFCWPKGTRRELIAVMPYSLRRTTCIPTRKASPQGCSRLPTRRCCTTRSAPGYRWKSTVTFYVNGTSGRSR